MAAADLVTVTFRNHTRMNPVASKAQGRPIYKDMEVCDVRFAGKQSHKTTFPAHELEPNATRERGEPITYAMLYNRQYLAFKEGATQEVSGTPLSEAPFLTEAKRRELKALNIHSVEALAAIDGHPLKQMGMGGRELKNQAQAYLEAAQGTADVTGMAATIASLQQQLAETQALMRQMANKAPGSLTGPEPEATELPDGDADPVLPEGGETFDAMSDAELKAFIKDKTGEPVRGNPNRETLLQRAKTAAEE